MKVLFISKDRKDPYIERAVEIIQTAFSDSTTVLVKQGQAITETVLNWQGDVLISYLCPWVLPESVLMSAKQFAINFHPATPDYPGTGCTNFALYNEEVEYGVMCHHMAAKVDSGRIIAVRRFPVHPDDTVYSLTQRCYSQMFELFSEIVSVIARGLPFPESTENWSRKPFRLAELNALKKLDVNMSVDEIKRRVRATTFPGTPSAYFEIDGMRFAYIAPNSEK